MQARFFCNAMPWVDCTALRYHCTKLPDVDLCPEAYAEGRFPPGCTARDFIKLDGARAPPVSSLLPALCKCCDKEAESLHCCCRHPSLLSLGAASPDAAAGLGGMEGCQ